MPPFLNQISIKVILLIGSLIFLTFCTEPEDPKGVIMGTVTLVGTQVPIEGIVISFSGPRTGSVATGSDGTFSFTELPIGEYTIRVSVSFSYLEVSVPNQTVRGDQTTSVDISLTPKGSISGTILEEGSTNAIEGASVSLSGGPLNLTTSLTTVTDGKYSFSAIPDGSYIVSVSHPDYVNAEKEITVLDGGNVQADIPLMKESGSINGKLTINGSQIPVSGVVIDLRGPKNDSQISDENGSFSFSDLPVGEYSLSIEVPSSYNDVSDITASVTSGETTEIPILLTPKGGISGKVSGEDKPGGLISAQVKLTGGPTNVSKSATTNTSGEYSFTELADGAYQLEASHPDYASDAKTITLADGSIEMVDFTLSKSKGSLSGKVTVVGTQIPISGIGISLSGTMETSTTTNDEGRYTFANIPVGTYELEVGVSSDYKPVASISVSIKKDETTTRDITLTPKGGIAGKITQEGTTNGIAGANVRLSDGPTNEIESKTTGISGQYSFDNLLSGTYTISVTHPNFGDESEEFKVSDGEITKGDISLATLGPNMVVIPTELDFGLENSQLSINIRNQGSADLNWEARKENEEISIQPTSGIVKQNQSQSISVSLDRSKLSNGEYEYSFSILSNDRSQDINVKFIVNNPSLDPCEGINVISNFSVVNNGCKAPCELSFNNSSANASNFLWDFGDGSFSTELSPVKTYSKPGNYKISLVATNGLCRDTFFQTVNIGWQTFEKSYGGPEDERAISVVACDDGGYAMVGYKKQNDIHDLYFLKINSQGELMVDEEIGDYYEDMGYAIIQTDDGGFLLGGSNRKGPLQPTNAYLVKLGRNGQYQWDVEFGVELNSEIRSIQQTPDGYILLGCKENEEGKKDIYLIKVNRVGSLQWEETFGGSENEEGYSVIQTSDGGFLITGFTLSSSRGERDMIVIKTLSNGDKSWERSFGTSQRDVGFSVLENRDGEYIIVGRGDFQPYYYLVILSRNGDFIDEKFYGENNLDDLGRSVIQASDGSYFIAGYSQSRLTKIPDVKLMKISRTFTHEKPDKIYGGTGSDTAYDIAKTQDGGLIIVGETNSFGNGGADVYIIKTDDQGNLQ